MRIKIDVELITNWEETSRSTPAISLLGAVPARGCPAQTAAQVEQPCQ